MPDNPEVGNDESASVSIVALRVFDRVQLVNRFLPGPHVHLSEGRFHALSNWKYALEVQLLERQNVHASSQGARGSLSFKEGLAQKSFESREWGASQGNTIERL